MTSRNVFVTGTDTGVGKTHASAALLMALRARGLLASGMKPVASGCRTTPAGLRNEDAEALIAASDPVPAYADCNPFAFAEPIAPHIAAARSGSEVTLEPIQAAYARIAHGGGRIVVEGVGGWAAPLSPTLMQADLAHALDLDVILVVGLRLGCLSHALLSARAIEADGCRLVGWIANRIDPAMPYAQDNIDTLRTRLAAPLLGVLEHAPDAAAESAARHLDAGAL
jgi:dethiobiotin synthetase